MDDRNKFNLRLSSLSIRNTDSEPGDGSSNSSSSNIDERVQDNSNNGTNIDMDDAEQSLLSILPSYHMYQSTISKNLTPTREDRRGNPPSYELAPQSSNNSSVVDYFEGVSLPTTPELSPTFAGFPMDSAGVSIDSAMNNHTHTHNDDNDNNDNDDENWSNTIVENAHKLKRLTSTNKEISKSLLIETVLTESIGKIGKVPKKIDPLSCEFKQGDYIYGYVLVTNKTNEDIPFDMFSVILEGCAIFNSNRNNIVSQNSHVVRFLTMFDFNASWNDANLDRLITDHNNPYVPSNALDPVDNTYVQLNHKKIFQPNVTYKKFFTFKLPEKLLDCTCYHGFVKHLQLPPTLGISRYEIITNLRRKWKSKDNEPPNPILDPDHPSYRFASLANDFAPTDSSISYSISARVIGKASDYKSLCKQQIINANEDEYVVANEDYCYLRVIPSTNSIFELNRSMIDEEAKSFYINLKQRIEEKLELGKQLSSIPLEERLSGPTPPPLEPTASALEISKMEQSYYSKIRKANGHHNNGFYEVFLPHRKKVVFGPSKVLGLIAFTTRKTTYRVDYTSLSKFNTTNKPLSSGSKISIPLEITYVPTGSSLNNIPEFKKITVDLMILTIKSKRLPIPLVFLPEMLFENSQKESDNFDVITIKRFQKYAMDLSKLLKEFGESLQVEKDLIYDLKCLANLSTKYDVLKLPNVSYSAPDSNVNNTLLSSIPWQKENLHSSSESSVRHFKKFNLNLDIADAIPAPSSTPGSSEFCLVPDFQFCCLSRLYYLKLTLKTQANEKINLHVPLVLQRSNGKQ